MNSNMISAIFDNHSEAEAAVRELRGAGVADGALSVIARQDGRTTVTDGSGDESNDGRGSSALKGAVVGGGAGALLGLAALAIPGVGPLAAAGAIAASAAPEAAAIGAGAGALAGGLSGLLKKHGVSDEDAGYYESRIKDGGVFVSVDAENADVSPEMARDILFRHGGHNSSQPRMAAAR